MKSKGLVQKFGLAGFAFFSAERAGLALHWRLALLGLTSKNDSPMQLKVSVYDTYVPKKQGGVMHFDILVDSNEKDLEKIYGYGREYLLSKRARGGNRSLPNNAVFVMSKTPKARWKIPSRQKAIS